MKKRTLTKKQKVWKHVLSVLGLAFLFGLLAPFDSLIMNPTLGLKAFTLWRDAWTWLFALIISPIVYFGVCYFFEYHPREFYYCFDLILITIVTVISFFALVTCLALASVSEGILLTTSFLLLTLFIFLFIIYVTWHRGLAIYKDKIRIFKFRIKTYHTTVVDSIFIEHGKFTSTIQITVCGDTTTFRLPTISAKICEQRLKTIPTANKEPKL